MAISSVISTQIFVLLFLTLCNALYEDQVGKFDWKRSFLGRVQHAKFHHHNSLIVTTAQNIVARLNGKSGKIHWRQTLEDPPQKPHLLQVTSDKVLTISGGDSTFYVRTWDFNGGALLYDFVIEAGEGESHFVTSDDQVGHLELLKDKSEVRLTVYSKHGEVAQRLTQIKLPDRGGQIKECLPVGEYFTCLTAADSIVWFNVFTRDHSLNEHNLTFGQNLQLVPISSGKALVLIWSRGDQTTRALEIRDKTIEVFSQVIQSNAAHCDDKYYQLDVDPDARDHLVKISSLDDKDGKGINKVGVDYPVGLGAPYIVTGACNGDSCNFLLSTTDDALLLVNYPQGHVIWTREEALSDIVATEFFELPISELDASIENEFKSSNDVLSMFLHRITTQIRQIQSLIFDSHYFPVFKDYAKADNAPDSSHPKNVLVRDEFGLHKLAVVITRVGKLFGIDTLSGEIVWTYRLPGIAPFRHADRSEALLLVQRTARHAPLPAQCTLLARDGQSDRGVIFTFDPITGKPLGALGVQRLGYKIKQALILPHENEDDRLRPIIVVGEDDSIDVYPQSGRALVESYKDAIFVYTVTDHAIRGHRLSMMGGGVGDKIESVWNVNFGSQTKVVSVNTRPLAEHVHSQGRVLPDRSVYYKYVNPNLIAVATLSDDLMHKSVLSVYLIDGVTGLVLYSTSHKKAKGPVHVVHSENWLVYSFFNDRYRRFEMVAAELFEGHIQSNATAFSSFGVSQLPHVQSQAYIMPQSPVAMTATLTERGITNKFLLVALSNGGVTELPWLLLQPRFADVPCGPEESCIPYMPEIPLPYEATINYNQTLSRVRGIQVAPARLESTCHVLVYGLDLFYTRVAPSKTFDVLKEDFDHSLIVVVLVGLIVASYVSKVLASKKAMRQAWK